MLTTAGNPTPPVPCGVACVETVCAWEGKPVARDAVCGHLDCGRTAHSMLELCGALETLAELRATGVTGRLRDIAALAGDHPWIAHANRSGLDTPGHFYAMRWQADTLVVANPPETFRCPHVRGNDGLLWSVEHSLGLSGSYLLVSPDPLPEPACSSTRNGLLAGMLIGALLLVLVAGVFVRKTIMAANCRKDPP